jgi:hypothetical protein
MKYRQIQDHEYDRYPGTGIVPVTRYGIYVREYDKAITLQHGWKPLDSCSTIKALTKPNILTADITKTDYCKK